MSLPTQHCASQSCLSGTRSCCRRTSSTSNCVGDRPICSRRLPTQREITRSTSSLISRGKRGASSFSRSAGSAPTHRLLRFQSAGFSSSGIQSALATLDTHVLSLHQHQRDDARSTPRRPRLWHVQPNQRLCLWVIAASSSSRAELLAYLSGHVTQAGYQLRLSSSLHPSQAPTASPWGPLVRLSTGAGNAAGFSSEIAALRPAPRSPGRSACIRSGPITAAMPPDSIKIATACNQSGLAAAVKEWPSWNNRPRSPAHRERHQEHHHEVNQQWHGDPQHVERQRIMPLPSETSPR